MHNVFARIIAALLWLEKRLEPIAKHPLGRVGLVLFFVVLGFLPAHVVHAEEGPGVFETILLYIANIALTVAVVLSKLVIVIIQVLIPVMLYNNFSNSPVVTAGWAIVRDTVNMFFVIVLIAIAFGTIFGNARFKWQQQMTKLMIFAIVINFSKTLCGLMIDFGQVIMLTFANAIREIAAGNFVQMLGMGDVYSLSTSNQIFQSAATDSNATGPKAFDWFASSLASVFMMFIVLTTMLMLLAILMYRVVMLWILIVISPIAWFIGGAKGIITSGAYEQWWKKFICLVSIGPVLTFFLWLTLVVAGSGTNVDPGFITSGDASTAGGLLTKIFELDRLISFIISIAMLYAGFDAANGVCGGAGLGFISDQMKGGPANNGGTRAAKALAGLGARVGAKGARVGASAARFGYNKGVVPLTGMAGDKLAQTKLVQGTPLKYATSTGREGLYRDVAAKAGSGMIGKTIGRQALANAEKLGAERAEKLNMSGLQYKGDSAESKNATLMRMAEKGAILPQGKLDEQALMMDAMKDPARIKEMRANGSWDTLWARHGKDLQTNAKGNKATKAIMDSYKKSNPDATGSWEDVKDAKDAAGLSAFALASISDKKGKDSPLNMDSKFDKKGGGKMTVEEAIRARKMGSKEQQDALIGGKGAIYEGMKPEELGRLPEQMLANNLTVGMLDKKVGSADGSTVAESLMQSSNREVRAGLHKKAGENPDIAKSLATRAGLDLTTGAVDKKNKKRFTELLTQNPAFINNLSRNDFDAAMSNPETAGLIRTTLAKKGVLNSALRDINADSNSESSIDLRSRLEETFAFANPMNVQPDGVEIPKDMQNVFEGIQTQMKAVDERNITETEADVAQILNFVQKAKELRENAEKKTADAKTEDEKDEIEEQLAKDLDEVFQASDESMLAKSKSYGRSTSINKLLNVKQEKLTNAITELEQKATLAPRNDSDTAKLVDLERELKSIYGIDEFSVMRAEERAEAKKKK